MKLPDRASIAALYDLIHEGCLPGLWSRGVAYARGGAVLEDSIKDDEIVLRVHVKDRPASPKVSLWPQDEDWFCDCGDRNENCAHVAAAVIALKNDQVVAKSSETSGSTAAPHVSYRFSRVGRALSFERFIVNGVSEEVLDVSLVAYVGGVSAGRIESRALAVSKEDFGVDVALIGRRRGLLDVANLRRLLPALRDCSNVTLDGHAVRTSGQVVTFKARLSDEGTGFRLEAALDAAASEIFENGAALCGDVLRPTEDFTLESRSFSAVDLLALVTEVIPALQKRIQLEIVTTRLPQLRALAPRVVLRLEKTGDDSLIVVPVIVYGQPPIAELRAEDRLELLSKTEIPSRDREAEWTLARRLQTELHLTLGQVTKFQGEAAVRFTSSVEGWELAGSGHKSFMPGAALSAQLDFSDVGFTVSFRSESGSADPARVFQAWRDGQSFVSLLGGGFAPLPLDWLARFGARISALLAVRDQAGGKSPAWLMPELAAVCDEAGYDYPVALRRLRTALETSDGIPSAILPRELRAELRGYQVAGINWLAFLRDAGLGALLADDMGLGKTLQALCVLRGRTLIVAPTSVLGSWSSQIEQFRPGLSYSVYHGGGRVFDETAEVILTTYAILRLERERLCSQPWGTVILDEAQTIKNPDSQVARAAHGLRGDFRIALSGTPVENRLDDLWSQFQFLNPGLLGSRSEFVEQFSREPQRLRARIRPFLLRRLKREVAPELPPRTEITLHCELSGEERDLYGALLTSTRQEALAELQTGGNVLKVLEILLRLRQACCHPSLVPGQVSASSSKLELLLQTLETSIGLGHRALVFSQWTSYLDLIERRLASANITFTRLDGTTRNRQDVVDRFQDAAGPNVMLLSLKAGGVGLTLTAADHIFIMDPWWNPAVEDQAADRAHRIGQLNPVLIHRLIAKDTVEERILLLQKKKLEVAGAVLHDSAGALTVTRDDLMNLLME